MAEDKPTPPEHAFERRRPQVTNDLLAERLDNMRSSVDQSVGMLREVITREMGALTRNVEKLQVGQEQTREALTRMDERIKVLELAKAEQDRIDELARQATANRLVSAQEGAGDARMFRSLAAIAVTLVTIIIGVLGVVLTIHGVGG